MREFYERNHQALSVQLKALRNGGHVARCHPHPIPIPIGLHVPFTGPLYIRRCEKCLVEFHFNGIVLSPCLHTYHPWCAFIHFSASNQCADPTCGLAVSPEWAKSFGFREFDRGMQEKEQTEGYDDSRRMYLSSRRDATLFYCKDVGE